MAKPVIMPRFGMTQEEATIVKWLVKEGDRVEPDDPLAEVTTDKVNMEVPAPAEGLLGGIRYPEGTTVPVTRIIAYILQEGEAVPEHDPEPDLEEATELVTEPPASQSLAEPQISPLAMKIARSEGVPLAQVQGSGPEGRITRQDVEAYLRSASQTSTGAAPGKLRATPAARRTAREGGIDLGLLEGSGPRGRIQAADVAAAGRGAGSLVRPQTHTSGEPVLVPLLGLRKTIAERMQSSAQEAPHISFDVQSDMTRSIQFRQFANERAPQGLKVSMTALLVKIVSAALRRHPGMNAYMQPEGILLLPNVNVGVAVAMEEGLIVPVVHDADQKSLYQVAHEVNDLSERARAGKLLPDDVASGTFTISNLGMFGIDRFTAIINPPQVGILAVGRTEQRFIPGEDGSPIARPMMTLTLSADHRALDGAQAARFLADVRDSIDEPASTML